MLDIVNSMLDVSRIDSQTLKLVPEKIEFDAIIERVHQEFLIALEERSLEFNLIGFEKLPLVMADPDQIYKVIYHLVMNAIKYTPDGGKITASGACKQNSDGEDEIEITISDTGIGIDLDEQELIFEKFYQTGEVMFHSSGKTKFKGGGPGLGLAIARGIVLAHNGELTVSSPGHDEDNCPGTKFIVRLPVNGQ
jgi:signal transduction histidine kinase